MGDALTIVYASRMKPSIFWRLRAGSAVRGASWLFKSSFKSGVRSAIVPLRAITVPRQINITNKDTGDFKVCYMLVFAAVASFWG